MFVIDFEINSLANLILLETSTGVVVFLVGIVGYWKTKS